MTQTELHRAISRATGDDVETIARRGFSLLEDEPAASEDDLGLWSDPFGIVRGEKRSLRIWVRWVWRGLHCRAGRIVVAQLRMRGEPTPSGIRIQQPPQGDSATVCEGSMGCRVVCRCDDSLAGEVVRDLSADFRTHTVGNRNTVVHVIDTCGAVGEQHLGQQPSAASQGVTGGSFGPPVS